MSALAQANNTGHLQPIIRQYDVGDVIKVWPATQGIENQNYFLQTQGINRQHSFVLTLLMSTSNAGEAYVPMMRLLDHRGLPVAPPIDNRQGQAITDHDGQLCMLQPKLAGHHTVNPTLKQIEGLARFMGRMHRTPYRTEFNLPEYPRAQSWLVGEASKISAKLPFSDRVLLTDNLTQVISLLSRGDTQALPRGLIHADLFRDNVLFTERGLAGVLDFHHAASGYFIYDLAVAANDWCSDASGLLDPERVTHLLRAYHAVRPMTEPELWFFSLFAQYAALTFWLSRAVKVHASTTQGNERTKNPDEFKRILEQLGKHHFYLDYRALSK